MFELCVVAGVSWRQNPSLNTHILLCHETTFTFCLLFVSFLIKLHFNPWIQQLKTEFTGKSTSIYMIFLVIHRNPVRWDLFCIAPNYKKKTQFIITFLYFAYQFYRLATMKSNFAHCLPFSIKFYWINDAKINFYRMHKFFLFALQLECSDNNLFGFCS